MKTLLIKNGGLSVLKPSRLSKVIAESQRNYALLKEKDAEIKRLKELSEMQSASHSLVLNGLKALMARDVKLADELEKRAKALEDCYFEEWNSCHFADLHTTWETIKKVVGLLRGETK